VKIVCTSVPLRIGWRMVRNRSPEALRRSQHAKHVAMLQLAHQQYESKVCCEQVCANLSVCKLSCDTVLPLHVRLWSLQCMCNRLQAGD